MGVTHSVGPLINRLQTNVKGRYRDLEFYSRFVVLYGKNGSGKTALMNALQVHFGADVTDLGGRDEARAGYLLEHLAPGEEEIQAKISYSMHPEFDSVCFLDQRVRATFGANEASMLCFISELHPDQETGAALRREWHVQTDAIKSIQSAIRDKKKTIQLLGDNELPVPVDLEHDLVDLKDQLGHAQVAYRIVMADLKGFANDCYELIRPRLGPVGWGYFKKRLFWTYKGNPWFSGWQRIEVTTRLARCLAHCLPRTTLCIYSNEDRWLDLESWCALLDMGRDMPPNVQVFLLTPSEEALRRSLAWAGFYQVINLEKS